jgi:hypothetical protein
MFSFEQLPTTPELILLYLSIIALIAMFVWMIVDLHLRSRRQNIESKTMPRFKVVEFPLADDHCKYAVVYTNPCGFYNGSKHDYDKDPIFVIWNSKGYFRKERSKHWAERFGSKESAEKVMKKCINVCLEEMDIVDA